MTSIIIGNLQDNIHESQKVFVDFNFNLMYDCFGCERNSLSENKEEHYG